MGDLARQRGGRFQLLARDEIVAVGEAEESRQCKDEDRQRHPIACRDRSAASHQQIRCESCERAQDQHDDGVDEVIEQDDVDQRRQRRHLPRVAVVHQQHEREEERQAVEEGDVGERHDVTAPGGRPPVGQRKGEAEAGPDPAQHHALVGLRHYVRPDQIEHRKADYADDGGGLDLPLGMCVVFDVTA